MVKVSVCVCVKRERVTRKGGEPGREDVRVRECICNFACQSP
uniref:Uncharacterized protein n=1 Tax=Arundo donax TaxID=35708 RepID=A0A0A9EFK5_ARUDO